MGGDGLIHEVMNGFALHPHSTEAFNIPVAPIPTGSGNGTSLNLLGTEVSSVSIVTDGDVDQRFRKVLMCQRLL
jgi:diacylglycerol kinase family enzyme